MNDKWTAWRAGAAGAAGAVLFLGVLMGVGQSAAAAGKGDEVAWPSPPPCGTPGANVLTPPANCTPPPTRTMDPNWTPPPTRTPDPNRTPWPCGTVSNTLTPPANCTPPPTRTPDPNWTPPPTRTPDPNWTPPPTPQRTPLPTCTPRPMVLKPAVQFGHGAPGTNVQYRQVLLNRFSAPTDVSLFGQSWNHWDVAVRPTQLTAQPGISNTIGIQVSIPVSPTTPVDLERVVATLANSPAYTTTAYLVTIVHRQAFTDVAAGDWSDDPIQYLAGQGVVSGYADGGFHPSAYVTRGQFAKMLVGANHWDLITPATPTFSDVPAGSTFYAYIETAVAHGVIGGYADGTFHPGALLTRAQLAKIISVAQGWTEDMAGPASFTDVHSTDWFAGYAGLASSATVMGGYPDGTFRPNSYATRAQVAKVLTLSLFTNPLP